MLVIVDGGNHGAKYVVPRTNTKGWFLNNVVQLTDADWNAIVGRGKPGNGLLKVNGVPYAVGDVARRFPLKDKPKGAARYNELYYGAILAQAFVQGIGKSSEVTLYATHAPQDHAYAGDLKRAAKRTWKIESEAGYLEIVVKKVVTLDEPVCAIAHCTLKITGEEYEQNPLIGKSTLAVDIGGYTTDTVRIERDGKINQLAIKTKIVGTIDSLERFEKEIRIAHRQTFVNTQDIDPVRIEEALITGVFQFGKIPVDCKVVSTQILTQLTNNIVQVINSEGGAANYDLVLLSGGGAALVIDTLAKAMPQIEIMLSDKDRGLLRYVNALGAGKIAAAIGDR